MMRLSPDLSPRGDFAGKLGQVGEHQVDEVAGEGHDVLGGGLAFGAGESRHHRFLGVEVQLGHHVELRLAAGRAGKAADLQFLEARHLLGQWRMDFLVVRFKGGHVVGLLVQSDELDHGLETPFKVVL